MGKRKAGFRKWLALVLTALLVAVGFAAGTGREVYAAQTVSVSAYAMYDYAYQVLDLVNQQRRQNGCQELVMDADLLEAAMQRAAEISVSFSHTRPDGSDCFTVSDKSYGENIAEGQNSPSEVMEDWMNSTGHRQNILNSGYVSIGIGVVWTGSGYDWVQEFGYGDVNAASRRTDEPVRTFYVQAADSVYSSYTSGDGGYDYSYDDSSYDAGTEDDYGEGFEEVYGEWKSDARGWWFALSDGTYVQDCLLAVDGDIYIFGQDGYMLTGWQVVQGSYYYFHANGALGFSEWVDGYWLSDDAEWRYAPRASWKLDGTGWYYQDTSGWYATGWQYIDGSWYWFNGSGYMVTGWQYINGSWYWFDGSGHMLTGWQYINGSWYYFTDSGAMAANQYVGSCWVGADGAWQ